MGLNFSLSLTNCVLLHALRPLPHLRNGYNNTYLAWWLTEVTNELLEWSVFFILHSFFFVCAFSGRRWHLNQPWMSGCGDWERRAIEVEGMEALKGKRREDLLGRVSALVENARQRVVGSLPWATKTGGGAVRHQRHGFSGLSHDTCSSQIFISAVKLLESLSSSSLSQEQNSDW